MALDATRVLKEVVRFGLALSAERDLTTLLESSVTSARDLTGAQAGTLFLRDGDALRFAAVQNDELAGRYGDSEMRRRLSAELLPRTARALASHVARTGELLNIPDAYEISKDRPYAFNSSFDQRMRYETKSVLTVPLRQPSEGVMGVLQLINALDERGGIVPFEPQYEELVSLLAAQAAVAIRNIELEDLSFRDSLTGAFNRRYLMLRLREELARFARVGEPLSLVFFDLDHFKEINDAHGHDAGDAVLQSVAQLLMHQSREYTVIARYGGDEFAALLPSTSKEDALMYAERLRRIIACYPFSTGCVTTSIGAITLPADISRGEDLVAAVDAALYAAKRQGGNRVSAAEGAETISTGSTG